jgi:dTDP-L-rhamnose 4-epimerase
VIKRWFPYPKGFVTMSSTNVGGKVLVTGGAGFIGSHVSELLLSRGYQVTVLDNLSHQVHSGEEEASGFEAIRDKVTFLLGDVRDMAMLRRALVGQDAVIHLAANTGTGQSMYEIREYSDVNVVGTASLLEAIVKSKLKLRKMIVASSRAVYGEGNYLCATDGEVFPEARSEDDMSRGDFGTKCPICGSSVQALPTDERAAIEANSIYAATKYTQEQMFSVVSRALNIPTVVLRYQNVYGPGQSLTNPYTGILSIFSTLLQGGENVDIFEDGLESRDFIFIDDVASATVLALEGETKGCEVFNVGSGGRRTVKDVAELLKWYFESDSVLSVTGKFRLGDIRHNFADISKVKSSLGFVPHFSFEDGLKEFVTWVKKQKAAPISYEQSLKEMAEVGLLKEGRHKSA